MRHPTDIVQASITYAPQAGVEPAGLAHGYAVGTRLACDLPDNVTFVEVV